MSLPYIFLALFAGPAEYGLFCLAMRYYKRWKFRRLLQGKRSNAGIEDLRYALEPQSQEKVTPLSVTPKVMGLHRDLTKGRSDSGILAPLNKPSLLDTGETSAFNLNDCLNKANEAMHRLRKVTGNL